MLIVFLQDKMQVWWFN